jgi:DNA modification methylase
LRDIHEYRVAETHFGSKEQTMALNSSENGLQHTILIFSKGEYKREKGNKENTISREQFIEWTKSIWTIKAESAKKIGHPAPFPEELPYRLIQLYSFKDDIILDPFMGSGTTAIAALKSNRKFVGYDINKEYIKLAQMRVEKFFKTNKNYSFVK